MSYDNTGHLGASTWRHVAFVERPAALPGQGSPRDGVEAGAQRVRRRCGPAASPAPTSLLPMSRRATSRCRCRSARPQRALSKLLVADDVRRLQALRARRLPGGVPHRLHRPHRVRLGVRAARRLQRLRLLRLGLPVRRHRSARGRRPRLEVHPLLRPARRAAWCRPARRPARPPRSSSASSPSCARARTKRVEQLQARGVDAGLPLRRGRGEPARHRGAARVLPALRRAGGLQPAARPGGPDREDRRSWYAMAAGVVGARGHRARARSPRRGGA